MTPAASVPTLTPEEADRAADRQRVLAARHGGHGGRLAWLLMGPGVLAMLGENDGPSMLSYAASGATYGIGFFLPFILVTFAAAYVVQEMSMRLGAISHRGYGELIFQLAGRQPPGDGAHATRPGLPPDALQRTARSWDMASTAEGRTCLAWRSP